MMHFFFLFFCSKPLLLDQLSHEKVLKDGKQSQKQRKKEKNYELKLKHDIIYFTTNITMISFKHKSTTKQIKIKSKSNLEERMSPWLQEQFNIRNPIVGFKVAGNVYYDAETFYSHQERFYGQQVQIIDANDQLEVSFVSENLNSSSFIRPTQPISEIRGPSSDQFRRQFEIDEEGIMISDLKAFEKKLPDTKDFNILFNIHPIYKKEIVETVAEIRTRVRAKIVMFMKLNNQKFKNPTYRVYIGKKKIIELSLTKEFKATLELCISRYFSSKKKFTKERQPQKEIEQQQMFKTSYEQENEAPSFTTYQLQQRLNQDACMDYLLRMFQEKYLKKYEYSKLCEKCEDNFVEFYRIFCEGVIDNDYESFKHQVLHKVEDNLEILLSNVDEMDLSRPISREEQRKQNLKKSVPKLQIVKVQNYFEILDQLKPFLSYEVMTDIKNELLQESEDIFVCFSDFLSRKITRQELAFQLQKVLKDKSKRPVSRCLPRNRTRQNKYEGQLNVSPIPERAQEIRLMSQEKIDSKEVPPMFGSSKNNQNFSPIKYMSDIQSNYKQAWSKLQSKADSFEPEQYGLLYHYLQTRDDSISNHIQELQWNEQGSIEKLKQFLGEKIIDIMNENFTQKEQELLFKNRTTAEIDCIYQNFKYESDLATFLAGLKDELAHHKTELQEFDRVLVKKSSDSQLFQLREKRKRQGGRRYSDQQDNIVSPKGSSFSYPKTDEFQHIEIFSNLWGSEFEDFMAHCNLKEEKEGYMRLAFKEGNPSLYFWIHQYIQGKFDEIPQEQLKKKIQLKDSENRIIFKMVPIYNEILKNLVEQGKITDKLRKWHIAEFVDCNLVVMAVFQHYTRIKSEEELIQNLKIAYEVSNKDMEYYRNYLKRIQDLLKQVSIEDETSVNIFRYYPQQIKAICQLYYLTGNVDDLLENLHILHGVQAQRRKLVCATLNFSGINTNPFEYHDGSEEVKQLSEKMRTIIEKEKPFFDGCKLSVIDKHFMSKVSVRFGTEMVVEGTLPNKEQYIKLWRQNYDEHKPAQITEDTEEIKHKYSMFDYYCYISVVSHVYKIDFNPETYEIPNIQELDGHVLVEFLQKYFTRPASSLTDKEQIVMDYIFKNDIDIMFLQEAGEINWGEELVKDYIWTKNEDSAIIFKKQKIGHVKMALQEKYKADLNFNKDSAMFFSERGYLLISTHLTSKSHKVQQATQMFETLNKIREQHPLLTIIIGIDANHNTAESENNFFNTVPDESVNTTSRKKRTNLQVQFHKAEKEVSSIKDQILSTQAIKEFSVIKVNGQKVDEGEMLPSFTHPYDHFIVTAVI